MTDNLIVLDITDGTADTSIAHLPAPERCPPGLEPTGAEMSGEPLILSFTFRMKARTLHPPMPTSPRGIVSIRIKDRMPCYWIGS